MKCVVKWIIALALVVMMCRLAWNGGIAYAVKYSVEFRDIRGLMTLHEIQSFMRQHPIHGTNQPTKQPNTLL